MTSIHATREGAVETEHLLHLTLHVPVFGKPEDDLAVAERLLKHIHGVRPAVRMYVTRSLTSLPVEVKNLDRLEDRPDFPADILDIHEVHGNDSPAA